MIPVTLKTEIHTLSRQEKYHLIQILVQDLASDEPDKQKEEFLSSKDIYSVEQCASKSQAIDIFLKKWKGALKGVDADSAKHQYLHQKYQ